MSKHTRERIVYIRKRPDLIQIEHYELINPFYNQSKICKPKGYWKVYKDYRSVFEDLSEQMKRALLEEKFVPPWLYEEYQQAKANFFTAHEIVTNDFMKEAV